MNINFDIIKKYINPKSILDIGAHFGEFNIICSHHFPNSFILSIEANHLCEQILKQSGLNYIICLLGSKNQKTIFYKNKLDLTSTGNSIYKELSHHFCNENLISEELEMKTLDDVRSLTNMDFDLIKIDTQGSEIDILKGGINTTQKAKCILLEVSYKPYNLNAPLENEVIEYMDSIGFDKKEILDESIECGQRDILFVNRR